MSQFLTVKEAAQSTGKSPSSIRRVIYPILEGEDHPDRQHIRPTIEEVQQFRMKGENFAWRISEELLRREVPLEAESEKGSDKPGMRSLPDGNVELLAMLRRELDIKNLQITQQSEMLSKQMELISGLSERLREGNVLIGTLQQQLVLNDGSSRTKSNAVDAETKPAQPAKSTTQQASKPSGKSPAKTPPKSASVQSKAKRGFFGRLFS